MSIAYLLEANINFFNPSFEDDILDALSSIDADLYLDKREDIQHRNEIVVSGQLLLYGVETDRAFASRLSHLVQDANHGPCRINIRLACIEYLEWFEFQNDEEVS